MTGIKPGTYEDALYVATVAHDGQRRKFSNQPYMVHPIRVAARALANARDGEDDAYLNTLRTVAILHDVVEDTDVALGSLRIRGFSTEIASAVDLLTRPEGMSYADFIQRLSLSENPIAIRVKLADLEDNMSDLKTGSLIERYKRAHKTLTAALYEIERD